MFMPFEIVSLCVWLWYFFQKLLGLNSILFDQSLLHKYNIIKVGSDSKP